MILKEWKKREEPKQKTCVSCGKIKNIKEFYIILDKGIRRDSCKVCFDNPDKYRIRLRRTKMRRRTETKYLVNAKEMFDILKELPEITEYIKASGLSKSVVIDLCLGFSTKGLEKIINTIAFGKEYKDTDGTDLIAESNMELLESTYEKLTSPIIPGLKASDIKIKEMVDSGMTEEQIRKYSKIKEKTINNYFNK